MKPWKLSDTNKLQIKGGRTKRCFAAWRYECKRDVKDVGRCWIRHDYTCRFALKIGTWRVRRLKNIHPAGRGLVRKHVDGYECLKSWRVIETTHSALRTVKLGEDFSLKLVTMPIKFVWCGTDAGWAESCIRRSFIHSLVQSSGGGTFEKWKNSTNMMNTLKGAPRAPNCWCDLLIDMIRYMTFYVVGIDVTIPWLIPNANIYCDGNAMIKQRKWYWKESGA